MVNLVGKHYIFFFTVNNLLQPDTGSRNNQTNACYCANVARLYCTFACTKASQSYCTVSQALLPSWSLWWCKGIRQAADSNSSGHNVTSYKRCMCISYSHMSRCCHVTSRHATSRGTTPHDLSSTFISLASENCICMYTGVHCVHKKASYLRNSWRQVSQNLWPQVETCTGSLMALLHSGHWKRLLGFSRNL